MHLLEAAGVEKALHVVEEIIDRPDIVRSRVSGLAMPAHIPP
jgi:hypothetical protein